jgi:hypothetical protein
MPAGLLRPQELHEELVADGAYFLGPARGSVEETPAHGGPGVPPGYLLVVDARGALLGAQIGQHVVLHRLGQLQPHQVAVLEDALKRAGAGRNPP